MTKTCRTNDLKTMHKLLQDNIPAHVLIAAAVYSDNQGPKPASGEKEQILALSRYAETCMSMTDEARFTLYDYLDACVNSSSRSMASFLAEAEAAFGPDGSDEKKAAFALSLVHAAEQKRDIYSFPD